MLPSNQTGLATVGSIMLSQKTIRGHFAAKILKQVLSDLRGAHLTPNGSFFRLIGIGSTLMLKKFLSQSKRSYYDLSARVKPS